MKWIYAGLALLCMIAVYVISNTADNFIISTSDGLSLSLYSDGRIESMSINSTNFSINGSRNGFYMIDWRNLPITSSNLLLNHGYENISGNMADNWSFYGSGYSVSNLSHNGSHSIMIENTDMGKYGAVQHVIFNETMQKYSILKVFGWSRAENVSGEKDSHYSVYVDITYMDNTHLWGQVATFDTGTHDWQYSEAVVLLERKVKEIYVYALFRYHTGKVWFDDMGIKAGNFIMLNGSTYEINDKIVQNAFADNLTFNACYTAHDRYISINVSMNETYGEKAITLFYTIPVNLTGWKWGNDIRNEVIINATNGDIYSNYIWFGRRYTSIYPFSSISNNSFGISYAIPLDKPIIYRIYYSKCGYTICFDFSLSNESKNANFSFILYKNDFPEWGMRGALKKYYEIFPSYFIKRVKKEGIWMPFTDISTIDGYEDFYFAYHEGDNNVSWDDKHGIYSFVYTEPWFYWMGMEDFGEKPSYSDVILRLQENINSTDTWERMNSRAVVTSGAYRKNGSYLFTIVNAPWVPGGGWAALFDTNSAPSIYENNTFWNKAHVVWNLTLEPAFQRASSINATLDGVYLDSLEGYYYYMDNYRREHFRNISFPLSFDYNYTPTLPEIFTHFEFTKNVSNAMHHSNKLVMANGVSMNSVFFFPLIDIAGIEVDWLDNGKFLPDDDELFNFRRSMSYHKPYLLLMNTNFSEFGSNLVELYFKKCLFYGIYPSMFSYNACDSPYWENASLYNRDRSLFRKYIPIIMEINKAGWEPITWATVNSSEIYVERYGNRYFTVHNPTNKSKNFLLEINAQVLNISDAIVVRELTKNASFPFNFLNGSIFIQGEIEANDTMVFKIIRLDSLLITFSSGNMVNDGNISTNFLFNACASVFNNTGFIGFINANWSILNYGSNASINSSYGKIVSFSSGESNGLAILQAEYNGLNDTVVFNINSSLFSFRLYNGWNFITLPCENEYNASSLLNDIDCNIILSWNSSLQDFIAYVPNSPYNFAIEDGHGYLIAMDKDKIFSCYGEDIESVNITLLPGWNALGWFKSSPTNASSIYENITSCSMVLTWNASTQDLIAYVPGSPYNAIVKQGDAFFVAVSQQSQWHG